MSVASPPRAPFPVAVTAHTDAVVQQALAHWQAQPGALLPVLHAVQDALGYVPASAVPQIAQALNLSRAEVHGVISYYHYFRSSPPTAHMVQVCRAEACQAMGANALLAHVQQRWGCDDHGVSRDGQCTVQAAYCLGLCATAPAVLVNGQLHARMTPARLDAVLAAADLPPQPAQEPV